MERYEIISSHKSVRMKNINDQFFFSRCFLFSLSVATTKILLKFNQLLFNMEAKVFQMSQLNHQHLIRF